jgi:hypothetical protein
VDVDENYNEKSSSEIMKLYETDITKNPSLLINRLIKDPKTHQYKIMCNSTFDSKIVESH